MNENKPQYQLTENFRPEDMGAKELRNRLIKKTMVQEYDFSYMDAQMLLQANKKALSALESQKKKLDLDIQLQAKEVKKWEDEIAALHQAFPELAAEGELSPLQPTDEGKLPEQG